MVWQTDNKPSVLPVCVCVCVCVCVVVVVFFHSSANASNLV